MYEQAIVTNHLCKWFGDVVAVDNVSLNVPAGSVYAFLGPNGAGKTTTIRMLLGLIKPTGGDVSMLGEIRPSRPRRGLARVGSLVESPSIYGHLTGRENIEVLRRLADYPVGDVDRVLTIVGLQDVADRKAKTYSLGMKQRLGVAEALLGDPVLLLLDEPSNGLDPAGMREIRDLIRQLAREQGITVFLSTHLLTEVEQVATDVAVIRQGSLLYQGTLADLRNQSTSMLAIRCGNVPKAKQVLDALGWNVQADETGKLLVEAHSPSDAALVNRQLVQADVAVWELELQVPDLEHVFMSLVGDQPEPVTTRRVHLPAPSFN